MDTADSIFIGGAAGTGNPQFLKLGYANRHGLITGATGTGKTVSLQILAEGFSRAGVPVFMADVKGDLSGLSQPGTFNDRLTGRAETIGLKDYAPAAMPTVFWDLFGEKGHPIRATVSEMGPLLLSRVLDLNETQEGVLHVAFELADQEGLLILDLADLRSLMQFVGENAQEVSLEYGRVSGASVGAIQRKLLQLDQQGGEMFFGEPAINLGDFMTVEPDGRGRINILAADKLMMSPRLYATFQLWLLSELFEELPEVGDPDKPRLVFFFDEAHLLFDNMPKSVIERIEMVVRLIRSKGVGVYFVTQNPLDVPDDVLGQLGNRVQHALRAFTPRDQKAVRAAAETFRPNPAFDAETVIGELGVGEALVSTLEKKGVPTMVERTLVRPPVSRLGPATEAERRQAMQTSPMSDRYDTAIDRHSAHEELTQRAQQAARDAEIEALREEEGKAERKRRELEERRYARQAARRSGSSSSSRSGSKPRRRSSSRQSVGEAFAKSVARSVGSKLGREIVRGVLGSFFKGR